MKTNLIVWMLGLSLWMLAGCESNTAHSEWPPKIHDAGALLKKNPDWVYVRGIADIQQDQSGGLLISLKKVTESSDQKLDPVIFYLQRNLQGTAQAWDFSDEEVELLYNGDAVWLALSKRPLHIISTIDAQESRIMKAFRDHKSSDKSEIVEGYGLVQHRGKLIPDLREYLVSYGHLYGDEQHAGTEGPVGGGEGMVDCSNCSAGGQGSGSCSITCQYGTCSVSCQAGYFSCCECKFVEAPSGVMGLLAKCGCCPAGPGQD